MVDLSGMRILITNDDGIHAPGIEVLERIARTLSDDVWVVAPEDEQSGASHSLTLAMPIRVKQFGERRFAVKGTPTDSVMMGVSHVLKDKAPDLVLSGINRGANLADDVTYSGTVAGAMEGTQLGIPSIALSQTFGMGAAYEGGIPKLRWDTAEKHAPGLIRELFEAGWHKDVLLSINFPDCAPDEVKGTELTSQGKRDQSLLKIDERMDARGNPYYWLGFDRRLSNPPEGTDLRAIYEGRISVTPLHMNLTHIRERTELAAKLAHWENRG